ncbi:MAG: hypothetical protein Q7T33_15980 [Dehalococcoidia bacterium]|nr:hypothetical protein [Dehalococcoidia bacterium]
MPDLPEDLLAAVNDQAQARVQRNVQGYAKYLTPQAIDSLRGSFSGVPPRVSRYEIDSPEARGADFTVSVRYFVRDQAFVVRNRWHKEGDRWMIVHAERLWADGEHRPGILSRLAARLMRVLRHR